VVIAAGGGGIPLVSRDGQWAAVDAVVDKDRSSALLAAQTGVDTMVLVTNVDEVCVDFGRPAERALHDVTVDEMRAHLADGQFPPGSMGPKVDSALRFVEAGGRQSIITSRSNACRTHWRTRRAPSTAVPIRSVRVISGPADPSPYEFDPTRTALVCIDFQRDFVEPGGFGETLGNDVSTLRPAVAPTERVLAAARDLGLTVIHTREGHRPDLTDLFPAKRDRGALTLRIGDEGPMGRILVRGSKGHDIIPELYPADGEVVLDKPGKGAFYATDLETILRARGITNLILTGVTTEVCVQTTAREANDRGLSCSVLADCTGSYFRSSIGRRCR
jgi:nicotinamidase-related amidase